MKSILTKKALWFILLLAGLSNVLNAQVYIDYMVRSQSYYAETSFETLGAEPVVQTRFQIGSSYAVGNYSAWNCVRWDAACNTGCTYNYASTLWTGTVLDNADNIYIGIQGWESKIENAASEDCVYTSADDSDFSQTLQTESNNLSGQTRKTWNDFMAESGSSGGNNWYQANLQFYWEYSTPVDPDFSLAVASPTSILATRTDDKNYRITEWYVIVYSDEACTTIAAVNAWTSNNPATVTGLENGKTYYVKVKARNEDGESSYTDYQTITLPDMTYYVNQAVAASGDGTSWATAFKTLQEALDAADDNDKIFVAKGTYLPSVDMSGNPTPSDPRQLRFVIDYSLSVYGGFAGTENDETERTNYGYGEVNETILSGDIGIVDEIADNCYSVVTINNPTGDVTIDGFRVTKGNAGNGGGIGLYANGVTYDLFITDCSFIENYSGNGGASLELQTSNSGILGGKIENCLFKENAGTSLDRPAVQLYSVNGGKNNIEFYNCIFRKNSTICYREISTGTGSSIAAQLTNCLISGNSNIAIRQDGIAGGTTTTKFTNLTITGNTSSTGAIFSISNSDSEFENCVIWNNKKGTDYLSIGTINSNLTFTNTLFQKYDNTSYAGLLDGKTQQNCYNYPQFVTPVDLTSVTPPTDAGDFHFKSNSPCLDAGDNTAVASIPTDLDGETRIQNTTVDLGVYEGIDLTVTPTVAITASLSAFSTSEGTPSDAQTFTISGNELADDVTLSVTNGYEFSFNGVNFISSNYPLSPVCSELADKIVYIRLTGTTAGTFNGDFVLSSPGAISQTIAVTGEVTGTATPTITTTGTLSAFSTTQGTPSAAQTFTLEGSDLTANLNVATLSGYEYSLNGTDYFTNLSITPSTGSVSETVSIRLTGTTVGTFSGNIVCSSTGATSKNVAVSGTVSAAAVSGEPNALNLDGTDDFVNCGNGTSVQITGTEFTLEAWIKADTWETNVWAGTIISKEGNGTGYKLRCGNNGQLDAGFGDGTTWREVASASGEMITGQWYHVASVYNGTTLKLYIDGNEVGSDNFTQNVGNGPDNLQIGDAPYYTGRLFDGTIDEVRVWDIARTETQLQDNMYNELAGNESGLVAYYTFNQGTAGGNNAGETTLYDETSNGNNGTLTGPFTLNGNESNWITSQAMTAPGTPIWNGSLWSTAPSASLDAIIDGNYSGAGFSTANLTVNSGKTLTINTNECLNVTGTFTNNGNLILEDGAAILTSTSGISGVYKKTALTGADNWNFIGTPVNTFAVQNVFTSDYVYAYREEGDVDVVYDGSNSGAWLNLVTGNDFVASKGYIVSAVSGNKNFTGQFGQGNVSPTLEWTDVAHGFNLISNPYPAYLVWSAALSKSNLGESDAIWIWNGTTYVSYLPADNYRIAPGQSFFVRALNASASIDFADSDKACKSGGKSNLEIFKLRASANGKTDDLKIYDLDFNGSTAKMMSWDATVPQIYTIVGEKKNAIQIVKNDSELYSYELGFTCGTSGKYSISIADLGFVSSEVYLEDKAKNTMHDLSSGKYSFDYTVGDTDKRFVLHFMSVPTSISNVSESGINIYSNESKIYLSGEELQTVQVFDLSGKLLMKKQLRASLQATPSMIEAPAKGVLLVKVTSAKATVTKKVFVNY